MEKKLTLREIAPYLPYNTRVFSVRGTVFLLDTYSNMKGTGIESRDIHSVLNEQMKPILRPLSDLKDRINPIQHHTYLDGLNHNSIEKIQDLIIKGILYLEDYNYLIENHFDVFGLIEQGLAIDINTLNK